jgi:hypothetical protein
MTILPGASRRSAVVPTNPRPVEPNDEPGELHPATNPPCTLAEQLGETVDELRQLQTDFGLRPYRVFSVVYRWTGGAVGRGEIEVVGETELLPTPKIGEGVQGNNSLVRGELRAAGAVERGDVTLKEISPRYTEDQVRTLFHQIPLPQGHQGFVEVTMDARDGLSPRRRFIVVGAPLRRADAFEWRASLRRQDAQRDRYGRPDQPTRTP